MKNGNISMASFCHCYQDERLCDVVIASLDKGALPKFGLLSKETQWAFGAKMTSYRRRCDVITSHRRQYDVIFTSCARWEEADTY